MRTLFDLGMRRDAWTPSVGNPLTLGQSSIEDILKATVTGAGSAATEYEKAQAEKEKAAAAAAQAQTAASQAKAATAVASVQNPTVLGMPPLLAGVLGVGILGVIVAIVATR